MLAGFSFSVHFVYFVLMSRMACGGLRTSGCQAVSVLSLGHEDPRN